MVFLAQRLRVVASFMDRKVDELPSLKTDNEGNIEWFPCDGTFFKLRRCR